MGVRLDTVSPMADGLLVLVNLYKVLIIKNFTIRHLVFKGFPVNKTGLLS